MAIWLNHPSIMSAEMTVSMANVNISGIMKKCDNHVPNNLWREIILNAYGVITPLRRYSLKGENILGFCLYRKSVVSAITVI